ncbi:Uncharacterised protein [Bordetella pertussis]|nr:Uncharacterised protein [Bordetella pertussis]
MPTTVNCRMRGAKPAGLIEPCGASIRTVSPVLTPSPSARSLPSTAPNPPATRSLSLPLTICRGISDTLPSVAGSMPRTCTPRSAWPRTSMPCAATKGASPLTSGLARAACANWRHCCSTRSGAAPGI